MPDNQDTEVQDTEAEAGVVENEEQSSLTDVFSLSSLARNTVMLNPTAIALVGSYSRYMDTDFGQTQMYTTAREIPSGFAFLGGSTLDLGWGLIKSGGNLLRGDVVNPFDEFGRADNFGNNAERWTRTSIGDPLAEAVGAGGVQFRTTEELKAEYMERWQEANPESALQISEQPNGTEQLEAIANQWAERQGLKGGVWDYNYTTDNGQNWQPVGTNVATAVVVGNLTDPTILAGGVGILGKANLLRRGGQAMFVVGGVAISDVVVSALISDSAHVDDIMNLLVRDDDFLASERGIRYLQRELNNANENLINAGIEEGFPSTYLGITGELDEQTRIALYQASSFVRYRDAYKDSDSLSDQKAYQQILNLENRFYGLVEQYVNDPENFNPSQTDIISMQFWMAGNGFSGFSDPNVPWGLGSDSDGSGRPEGVEYLTSYLDAHFADHPEDRIALLRPGFRRDQVVAAQGNVELDEGSDSLIRTQSEIQADTQQMDDQIGAEELQRIQSQMMFGPKY